MTSKQENCIFNIQETEFWTIISIRLHIFYVWMASKTLQLNYTKLKMDQSSLTEKICSNGFFMFRLSAQVGRATALNPSLKP